jgi:hypothetical protein
MAISSFHGIVDEDNSLLRHDTMLIGKLSLIFWGSSLPSSSSSGLSKNCLKMEAANSF